MNRLEECQLWRVERAIVEVHFDLQPALECGERPFGSKLFTLATETVLQMRKCFASRSDIEHDRIAIIITTIICQ